MADRDRERIRSVVRGGHRLEAEDRLDHLPHLGLVRAPVAADGLLDGCRSVFGALDAGERRGDEDCPPRLPDGERDAGVCADERLLQSDGIRRVFRDQLLDAREDREQTNRRLLPRARLPPPVARGPEAPAAFVDDSVPARRRPWVDSENLHEDTLGAFPDVPAHKSVRRRPRYTSSMKIKLGVLLALSCAGLVAAVSIARPAANDGALTGTVGPGYSISLTQNGTKVTHLDPGTYTITVTDKADVHDFHLQGPGVDQATDIVGMGTSTWTVTFQDGGTYDYFCDAHPTRLFGTFTVGTVTATTTTTAAPAPPPLPALKVKAKAKATGRTVAVTATATRLASLDFGLWKGTKRVAHATAKAKTKTVKLKAPAAGRYVAKVTAKAGGKTATSSATVTLK